MFRSMGYSSQEDRSKHCTEAKSCLTLESSPSDNGLIRLRRRRNSLCGLQLDGFSGAMQWSHCANAELIDALWSGAFFPGPLIRQIYPSLLVCVFSRVFGFENVGLRVSTLRNHQVAKALRHPFLQTLIRDSLLAQ
jgi:hypothetical protein